MIYKKLTLAIALTLVIASAHSQMAFASDKHGHGEEALHKENGHIEISVQQAQAVGIENSTATSGQIKQTLTVYGQVVLGDNAISHVKARFPGLITKLAVNVGDNVNAGDVILEIESSDSLQRYTVSAPISGVITKRFANVGEVASDNVLLTIADYGQLWVQYKIFASQSHLIAKGQSVRVSSEFSSAQSKINYLLANQVQPFSIARVPLDNSQGQWSAGQMLVGEIVTSHHTAALIIDNRALQEIDGEQVIFVTNAGGYQTRHITLGQSDGQFSQVLAGLKAGEQYAVNNSYLLKADLGKSSASHAH